MTTNRNLDLDLGRALRGTSESRGDITGEGFGNDREPQDVQDTDYEGEVQLESPSHNLREVNIKPLDSGYLVKVGCQSVAIETTEALVKALNDYLTRPEAFERAWFKNKNRSKL